MENYKLIQQISVANTPTFDLRVIPNFGCLVDYPDEVLHLYTLNAESAYSK
jgi:hypothetical protein